MQLSSTDPETDMEMDMTPMIDVVFNLIIFFMVITDMTQQDLEYLVLPRAQEAQEDPGDDPERLIINIVNPHAKANKLRIQQGDLDPSKPPVFVEGRQVDNLDQMRQWLRVRLRAGRAPRRGPVPGHPAGGHHAAQGG